MAINQATLAAVKRIRRDLNRLTDGHIVGLTRAWVRAWDTLAPEFEAALLEILVDRKAGTVVSAATLARSKKLAAALQQALSSLTELSGYAETQINRDIAQAVLDAVDGHIAIVQTQLPPNEIHHVLDFTRSDPHAFSAIVERTQKRIHAKHRPLPRETVKVMKKELVRGIAVGDNPRTTARRIIRNTEMRFNGGLTRATTIARTEMLDAHREGTRRAAQENNDILTGWTWLATLDKRTCPSCLSNNGSVHPVDEFGPIDHAQGRCARVDTAKSWKDLGFDIVEPPSLLPDAEAWFHTQPEADQLQIMGPSRLSLLKSGDVAWSDLSTKVKTKGWRDSMVVTPVRDLVSQS